MDSCLDDEYWQQWSWLQPEISGVVISDDVTSHEGDSSAEHVIAHDDQSDEADEVESDGFSDWYGCHSAQDQMCRGRRESVLGTPWIDAEAYLRPPRSMLQLALSSHAAPSE